ncbi:MAG: serine--tRNA ligase [Chthoniobacterales bacterium]|nr:serine--tRNA ligase [Chthoniobacterales bacterium]
MLDIRLIREDAPAVKARLATRSGQYADLIDLILACDARRRESETRVQHLRAEKNRLSKEIGGIKKSGGDSSELEAQVKGFSEEMEDLGRTASELDAEQRDLLLRVPNLPAPGLPEGHDADANVAIRHWGEPAPMNPEDHVAIGERLGLFDLERAAKISGSGYVLYTGAGARLERALINFLLDLQTRAHGYTEIAPPVLVRRECMEGTGQLPKFEDDMYGFDEGAAFLTPTAEVSLTNIHRDEILQESELPLKYTACTPCFRREAGSAGRETRGMIRMHQFDKVELVKICTPEQSEAELESLTGDAEKVLQLLQLPYRVLELCTGDIGFSSSRTYDLEVWAPGQGGYLEVSSCSQFGDYQARRMNLRYKNNEGKNVFCHTLNGSGTALPRLYVALLETHTKPGGPLILPEPLHPYFGASQIG